MKITSVDELDRLRESLQYTMRLRELGESKEGITDVSFLLGDCDDADQTRSLMAGLMDFVEQNSLDSIRIRAVDQMETDRTPAMKVIDPNGRTSVYVNLNSEKLEAIAQEHLTKGEPIQALLDR